MTPARVGDGRVSWSRPADGGGGALASGAVLVLDDHQLVGTSLATALRRDGEDAHFVPAHSEIDVRRAVDGVVPGLLVLDLDLGRDERGRRVDTIPLIPELRRAGWRILVLSGSSNPLRIGAALHHGGFTWVPKSAAMPTLLVNIREARAGRSLLKPTQREELVRRYLEWDARQQSVRGRLAALTRREREVLDLLAGGMRAQAIANHFVVSLPTVRTQVRAVLGKLEVGSQLEAVALVRSLGPGDDTPGVPAPGVR
ncbi:MULTISPECIES: LuxR C-terminal-related transcriptional regulator [unclassified Pseudonocardia]|uniref:LuxR C-terminal-related transcriptional regulator n=1 Tax=unclassified Pseudonocardia TaxID=2619320 RepID=UPI000A918FFF|nr:MULTISPECIES: LuxR C-terminal-related transcriptional regulator [unclassified Pseudonocardia]